MKTLRIMKIVMVVIGIGLVGFFGNKVFQMTQPIEYTNEPVVATTTVEVVPVVEKSNIEKAKEQLDAAKQLLDSEEEFILAEIDAREARLEEIREVRLSFTEASNPQN